MKRIAGGFALLLAGLCGCISFTQPSQSDANKDAPEAKQRYARNTTGQLPPAMTTNGAPLPLPSSPQWSQAKSPYANQQRGFIDHTAARPALPPMMTANNPGRTPNQTLTAPTIPSRNQQSSQQQPVMLAMPGMPTVTTPKAEAQPIRQASHVQPEPVKAVTASRQELPSAPAPAIMPKAPSRPAVAVPPTPKVKHSATTDSKSSQTSTVSPLVRLVNTKRITLNFEVKGVGPSGLSSVELWYTQDGKQWKKHEAPTQAQAYVVEVDEEGMYGFTLLARSGTGLAKEPPRSGDQPQVWVVVDLSKPEVNLGDVTPSLKAGQQHVSVRWKASDKNLGRTPITLSYAENEEGPWKVIATGLENNGVYNWEVPKGTPAKVLVRVEASDLAGNVGRAQSTKSVLMDNSVPRVDIVNVEANAQR